MKIRAANAADLEAVRAIAAQSSEAAQWSEQQYAEMAAPCSQRVVLVAEVDGAVAGFLVAHEVAEEFELENVAVTKHARRRGVGSALVEELARRARVIHLEVRGKNVAARAMYERLGFRQVGLRKKYYDAPVDDAVLYTRSDGG